MERRGLVEAEVIRLQTAICDGFMPVQCMSRKRTTVLDPGVKCGGTSAMWATWTRGAAARLRDHVNTTIGFQELGGTDREVAESLTRMPGPDGNSHARHLLKISGCLQERQGPQLKVRALR